MKKKCLCLTFSFFLFFFKAFSLDYSAITAALSNSVYGLYDQNEGTTTFRSLLIPFGGRTESLGCAYTALCDDVSFLQYNPAASAIQEETQLSVFHNQWIADSKMETIAFTTRNQNLGFGGYTSCFYVPFTEYNLFGDRVASSYYTETTAALNVAYNFLAGYNFKGFSLGANLKGSWRGVPDYTDNTTNEIISGSGFEQSGLAIMADLGLLLQFNFLKFYSSRNPNVHIGFSILNMGAAITGFGGSKGLRIDDGLPTMINAGISVQFLKPVTISADVKLPVNLINGIVYLPYESLGAAIQFSRYVSLLLGAQLKGGNPAFSTGFEFELAKIRLNFNYTLDFTTSFNPLNRMSLSAKLLLGDKGRSKIQSQIDQLYEQGLKQYSLGNWEKSIEIWEEVLKINKRFDPAKLGIQSARSQIEMFRQIKNSLLIDQK